MAVGLTAVIAGTYMRTWTVTALDADTGTSIAHSMGTTPKFLWFTPAVTFASTGTPSFAVTADATSVFFNKSNTAGSGGVTAGTTVIGTLIAWLPHSSIQ